MATTITGAMDATFQTNVTTQSVHQFWQMTHDLHLEIDRVINQSRAIANDPNNHFETVDPIIINEGQAILGILDTCKASLDQHLEFLNWQQK